MKYKLVVDSGLWINSSILIETHFTNEAELRADGNVNYYVSNRHYEKCEAISLLTQACLSIYDSVTVVTLGDTIEFGTVGYSRMAQMIRV